jgi:hypothetical protein
MLRLSLGAVTLLAMAALPTAALDDAGPLPFAGRWKVIFVQGNYSNGFCVVRLDGTTAKARGKVVATLPKYEGLRLRNLKADAASVRFTLTNEGNTFEVTAYPPRGEDKPKMLFATIQGPKQLMLGRLEPSDQDELKERDEVTVEDGFDAFIKLMGKGDATKIMILKDIAERYAGKPAGIAAGQQLLQMLADDNDSTEVALRAAAKGLVDSVANYGREMEVQTAADAALELLKAEKGVAPALEMARRAEKLLTDTDPPVRVVSVLQSLTSALRKSGKADDARAFAPRLAKANALIDEEYEKTAIPFKPGKFGGRKGKSQRIALVELFTGAQCPPCVAADVAFDAALKTYGANDVAFLQYHLHIPGPDPLTNKETEARAAYYGNKIPGTPTAFLDGKPTAGLGGAKQNSEASYNTLCKTIDPQLEQDAGAELKLTATRKGDRISLKVDVADLKKTGDKVKLRLVLVEETARYTGRNGQRLHHHVVRAFLGGVDGMEMKEAKSSHDVIVDLADVRKSIGDYLTAKNKSIDSFFSDADMEAPLKELRVVALIQDDATQQVVQAAHIRVPAE